MLALCVEEGRVVASRGILSEQTERGQKMREEGGRKRGREMRGLKSDNEPRLDGGRDGARHAIKNETREARRGQGTVCV